jgi:uncharacterized membrane protein
MECGESLLCIWLYWDESQKIADTRAWRLFFLSFSFVDTTLLAGMGFHGLLLQVVVHRISFPLKGCS